MDEEGKTVEQATSTNAEAKGIELSEEAKKLIQSEVDRVRTKYVQEKKELETKLKEFEQSKMSEDEKRIAELQEKEKSIAEKEQAILKKELNLHVINRLNESKIPIDFADFLIGNDQERTDENIKKFSQLWKDRFNDAVQEINKSLGRKPAETNSNAGKYTLEDLKKMTREELDAKVSKEEQHRILRQGG